jgi:predicted O-methyltransferase YrrM
MQLRRRLEGALSPILDFLLVPFAASAAAFLWLVRRIGLQRLPLCRGAFIRIGLLPIRHHYYEPFTTGADLDRPLSDVRSLPGIRWNESAQLELLERLVFESELSDLRAPRTDPLDFRLENNSFEAGDAEFLYQFVRERKPKRVFEVGSGHSTLLVRAALRKNAAEHESKSYTHICIEPYEAPWLESAVSVVYRKRVEHVDKALFEELKEDDILFIDSSHVIRPQGDVVTEYLEILPRLRPGVIVHVHDIFSPRDYPASWVTERLWLWNEQYLLEALLTNTDCWEIVASLNMLKHNHFSALQRVCPYLTASHEPGSFYIRKIK